jgi:hypothetical protein
MPYCNQIAVEMKEFYNIQKVNTFCISLIRSDEQQLWYEFLVPKDVGASILSELPTGDFEIIDSKAFTLFDRDAWFTAYDMTNAALDMMVLIRSTFKWPRQPNGTIPVDVIDSALKLRLEHYAVPSTEITNSWVFVPKINLSSVALFWHPLLSDYLFSFVIGHILRYYPQLAPPNKRAAYILESWCKQSAQVALRYFLLESTTPAYIIKHI